ncbi:hypothetical protein TNCV_4148931 [Trichonephila clavipes]|nr:hypothetical protein TNCV_4148931 [Trichonephila clavipes]
MNGHTWHKLTFGSSSITRFIASLVGSLYKSFDDRKQADHICSKIDPDYTPCCHTRLNLAMCGSYFSYTVPQEHIQRLFGSMPRREKAVISNNGG